MPYLTQEQIEEVMLPLDGLQARIDALSDGTHIFVDRGATNGYRATDEIAKVGTSIYVVGFGMFVDVDDWLRTENEFNDWCDNA